MLGKEPQEEESQVKVESKMKDKGNTWNRNTERANRTKITNKALEDCQVRKAKALTNCIRNEKGGHYKIKDSRECYKLLYANKLVFLGEIDKLLEKFNW